jgi:hypothetical protein
MWHAYATQDLLLLVSVRVMVHGSVSAVFFPETPSATIEQDPQCPTPSLPLSSCPSEMQEIGVELEHSLHIDCRKKVSKVQAHGTAKDGSDE